MDLEHLSLLASALGGRSLRVAPAGRGERAWTDGATVFLDADAGPRGAVLALAVQASLLAAGSLAPDVLRELNRHPKLADRYLAVEGHRALAANADVLPPAARGLVDQEVAARSGSPAASLAAARGRQPIDALPELFGAIHPRRVVAAGMPDAAPTRDLAARPGRKPELAELTEDADEVGPVLQLLASPVGGGGPLGRLLARMFGPARAPGAGPAGADAPTHRGRGGARVGRPAVFAGRLAMPAGGPDDVRGQGWRYPEWDAYQRRYRLDWCTVRETVARIEPDAPAVPLDGAALRRPLARVGLGPDRRRRQLSGDELDIDALVDTIVATRAGSAPGAAVYVDSLPRRRDLAALVLLDCSSSASAPGATGVSVHEQQRAAAAALLGALHDLGDRVALYAFRSQGRSAVQLQAVKRFEDALDTRVARRLGGLAPGGYTRLGAAIRHGARVLENDGGTARRLLVVLSDGLAYDHGYEPDYGEADARRALAEARRRGIGAVSLSFGAGTDAAALRRVFGPAAHAVISRPEHLPRVVGPLFRSALRAAEGRRRAA
ncbi:VWA domain-containing protein [Frankia sp. AgB1.9]|uniref:nitric oxide reductase activation protein NorD n=1 Tax=unclassified Frankia TaxID=2632575 RepID=UPI00193278E4|nr:MULTISPECIES: VWA domain-containing protein [unclassified Frankia]MBL7491489.1 VWA domain-containing protein [Frankia sp. AgW1.1]MBL7546499.1 VWA domain-containing protein [Frankia sp. AgB1.9]MBL7620242.1 VWA domain-containing protein [Frankia sp. AgB1.8]